MFDLLRKLFKAFNSAQTPWQMSLALSLGMAMGLTPFSGIQTIVLIFIVFIINIHLGLFLVSAGFFSGIAYLMDPVFEQLGFAILNYPALQEIFTSAYNSGFLRLTYFNNTLVMGSTVVAFSLLIPMYFILNKIVYIYRDKIATKLSQYRFFKILGVEVTEKKDKFLRLWATAVFVILGALILVFVYMFMDSLAKNAIKTSIEKVTNKNVNINNVEVSFENSKFSIDGLDVYDEKVSLFMLDKIDIEIDFKQVLFNQYHIDNIDILGMRFDVEKSKSNDETKESTQNKTQVKSQDNKPISNTQKNTQSKSQQTSTDDSNMFDSVTDSLPKPEDLVARAGLSSSKNYEEAQEEIKGIETKYVKAINEDFSKEEIESIKNQINAIQKKIKSKNYTSLSKDLKTIKELSKKLKEKKDLALKLKQEFKKDKALITKYSKVIKDGALSDYKNLSENYNLDAKGGVNVIGVLFGDKVKGYSTTLLEYYSMAKPYLNSDEEEPTPPRGEGRWIKYKDFNNYAGMWIKSVNIDGKYDDQDFKANMTDISSDQKLVGQPMRVSVVSDGVLSKSMDLGISKLNSSNYSFKSVSKTSDYKTMDTTAKIKYTKTKFSSKYLAGINDFDVDIKATKEIVAPNLKITTNLDDKLKSIFKKVLEEKSKAYKKELKSLIDKNTKDSLAKLTKDNATLNKLEKQLGANINEFSTSEAKIKSIEKSTKNKASSKAKDEAKKLLKSFKF